MRADGSVWSWGNNSSGQLGDGTADAHVTAVATRSETASGGFDANSPPALSVNASRLSFGVQSSAGVSAAQTLTLTNTGDGELKFEGIVALGEFSLRNDCAATLAPAASCTLQVSFAPLRAGPRTGQVLIVSNAVARTVALEGTGTGDARAQAQVAAGADYSLALRSDGTLWAWGANGEGQLGDGSTNTRYAPVRVNGLTQVVGASAGGVQTLALDAQGTVWGWGGNGYGQLGDGTQTSHSSPVPVRGLDSVRGVSVFGNHALAYRSDGTVWAWGYNRYGQLGDGTAMTRTLPVPVSEFSGAVGVAAGDNHSLALKDDGTVWAWGLNNYGQLGDGTDSTRATPVQVQGLANVVAIHARSNQSFALRADGTVWVWGDNGNAQLGDGTSNAHAVPVQMGSVLGASAVAGGWHHTLSLKADGTVWATGYNGSGELGDGTRGSRSAPVQVSGLSAVVSVAAGQHHSVAMRADGSVWSWGNNGAGQLGDGTADARVNAVATLAESGPGGFNALGSHHLLEVTAVNGTVVSLPSGVACGVTCSADLAAGTLVTLTAEPAPGFDQARWTGCDSVAGARCYVTMNAARSVSVSFATIPAQSVVPGWNLLGNSHGLALDVPVLFGNADSPVTGVTENVVSVWKWDAALAAWAFYSPQLTPAQLATFIAGRNYLALTAIAPGEGYWVNASHALTLPRNSNVEYHFDSANYALLPRSWNLIATAQNLVPTEFANAVSALPLPASGVSTVDTFVSLWAWDTARTAWYFYSPLIEDSAWPQDGLAAVKSFALSRNYLHFQDDGKKIEAGIGFWVKKP